MRLNRFYVDRQNIRIGGSVKLDDRDVGHIRKVLRLSKGDQIVIFNGKQEYLAELNLVRKEFVTAIVKKAMKSAESESKVLIHVFQGLLKAGKMDTIIEKLTELGISGLVPFECEFSQSKLEDAEKKFERWEKISIAASKQSERVKILEILTPVEFSELEELTTLYDEVLFFTIPRENISESQNTIDIKDLDLDAKEKIAILIGPEGGFSPTEHKLALKWGFKFVTWNNTILRSETASIIFGGIVKFLSN